MGAVQGMMQQCSSRKQPGARTVSSHDALWGDASLPLPAGSCQVSVWTSALGPGAGGAQQTTCVVCKRVSLGEVKAHRLSMFCVKQRSSRPLSASSRMKLCVGLGL